MGQIEAFPGAIARGDSEVVRRQLLGVKQALPAIYPAFLQLCRATVQLRFGDISEEWKEVFGEGAGAGSGSGRKDLA